MSGLVVAALCALVMAVVVVVWKVIRPLPGITISLADSDRWIRPEFTDLDPVVVDGYLTDGYAQALQVERTRNDDKSRWLARGYTTVCAGLALVATAGGLAILDRYVD